MLEDIFYNHFDTEYLRSYPRWLSNVAKNYEIYHVTFVFHLNFELMVDLRPAERFFDRYSEDIFSEAFAYPESGKRAMYLTPSVAFMLEDEGLCPCFYRGYIARQKQQVYAEPLCDDLGFYDEHPCRIKDTWFKPKRPRKDLPQLAYSNITYLPFMGTENSLYVPQLCREYDLSSSLFHRFSLRYGDAVFPKTALHVV